MAGHRKLGRRTSVRISILRNLTTDLIINGHIETTLTRAREVKKIADRLVALAVKEQDNFTTKDVVVSTAKLDGKGKKVLTTKTSKNDREYQVVERELKTETQQVDNPSRLKARRQMMQWLVRSTDEDGRTVNPVNHLFNEVAPNYQAGLGGYTRIINLGPRRGDGAPVVRLELI